MRPCVGCSGCGGWRVYVAALLPYNPVLPVAIAASVPFVWVGSARLCCCLRGAAIGVALGFLRVRFVPSCGLRVALVVVFVEGRCLVVAGFHVGVRGKAAGRVEGSLSAPSAGPSTRASILPPASCLPVRCAPSRTL